MAARRHKRQEQEWLCLLVATRLFPPIPQAISPFQGSWSMGAAFFTQGCGMYPCPGLWHLAPSGLKTRAFGRGRSGRPWRVGGGVVGWFAMVSLENARVRVEMDADGRVIRLVDRVRGCAWECAVADGATVREGGGAIEVEGRAAQGCWGGGGLWGRIVRWLRLRFAGRLRGRSWLGGLGWWMARPRRSFRSIRVGFCGGGEGARGVVGGGGSGWAYESVAGDAGFDFGAGWAAAGAG